MKVTSELIRVRARGSNAPPCRVFKFKEAGRVFAVRRWENELSAAEILRVRHSSGHVETFNAVPYNDDLFREVVGYLVSTLSVREIRVLLLHPERKGAWWGIVDLGFFHANA